MAKTRRSAPGKRLRILNLRALDRLPPPPRETGKQREARAEDLFNLFARPGTLGHFVFCSHCEEEARRREDEAQLRKEATRQIRLEEFKRELRADLAAPRKARGKLSPAALDEHLKRHPLGKRNSDGSPFSDAQRIAALKRDQGITIHRTALVKRLAPLRRPLASP